MNNDLSPKKKNCPTKPTIKRGRRASREPRPEEKRVCGLENYGERGEAFIAGERNPGRNLDA